MKNCSPPRKNPTSAPGHNEKIETYQKKGFQSSEV